MAGKESACSNMNSVRTGNAGSPEENVLQESTPGKEVLGHFKFRAQAGAGLWVAAQGASQRWLFLCLPTTSLCQSYFLASLFSPPQYPRLCILPIQERWKESRHLACIPARTLSLPIWDPRQALLMDCSTPSCQTWTRLQLCRGMRQTLLAE